MQLKTLMMKRLLEHFMRKSRERQIKQKLQLKE